MKFLIVLLLATAACADNAWTRIHGDRSNSRIVGGQEVAPNSVPWQVALDIYTPDGAYFCGGSLVSADQVLTAAHCCELSANVSVVAGAHYINNKTEATQQTRQAANITIHPGWDNTTLLDDICVIRVDAAFELNDVVKPVGLPKRSHENDDFSGRIGTATGWGLDSDSSTTISPVLRTVDVPVITNAQCRTKFGLIGLLIPLHPSNVCIDGVNGKGTCSGDSGGPLVVYDTLGNATEIGLTSFGISVGCEAGYPAVFTRLTSYMDWIALTTGIPTEP